MPPVAEAPLRDTSVLRAPVAQPLADPSGFSPLGRSLAHDAALATSLLRFAATARALSGGTPGAAGCAA